MLMFQLQMKWESLINVFEFLFDKRISNFVFVAIDDN